LLPELEPSQLELRHPPNGDTRPVGMQRGATSNMASLGAQSAEHRRLIAPQATFGSGG